MNIIAALIGLLVLLAGLYGLVFPTGLMAVIGRFRGPRMLYAAAGIRLVVGVLLIVVASATRWPLFVMTVGIIALIAAILIPFVGVARFNRLIDWWLRQSPALTRAACLVAVALGALVIYASGFGG